MGCREGEGIGGRGQGARRGSAARSSLLTTVLRLPCNRLPLLLTIAGNGAWPCFEQAVSPVPAMGSTHGERSWGEAAEAVGMLWARDNPRSWLLSRLTPLPPPFLRKGVITINKA